MIGRIRGERRENRHVDRGAWRRARGSCEAIYAVRLQLDTAVTPLKNIIWR